jgi:hypothetical protein
MDERDVEPMLGGVASHLGVQQRGLLGRRAFGDQATRAHRDGSRRAELTPPQVMRNFGRYATVRMEVDT